MRISDWSSDVCSSDLVANQRESIDVAQRSLHLSRRSFEVGNSGVLQILESERLYQRARSAMVDAQARQYLNVARLYVATAGGWTGPAVKTGAKRTEGLRGGKEGVSTCRSRGAACQ